MSVTDSGERYVDLPELRRSALHQAAASADVEFFQRELQQISSQSVNRNEKNTTWLHAAAESGSVEVILTNRRLAADIVDVSDVVGRTPLHLALYRRRTSAAAALLACNADVNVEDRLGNSAARLLDADKRLLLKVREEVFRQRSAKSTYAAERLYPHDWMRCAATEGNLPLVQWLCSCAGGSINVQDSLGRTPLHEAAQAGHASVVSHLLRSGANPSSADWRGSTALHYACVAGRCSCVALLAAVRKFDVNCRENFGRCPLALALEHRQWAAAAELLRVGDSRVEMHFSDEAGVTGCVLLKRACLNLVVMKCNKVPGSQAEILAGLLRRASQSVKDASFLESVAAGSVTMAEVACMVFQIHVDAL